MGIRLRSSWLVLLALASLRLRGRPPAGLGAAIDARVVETLAKSGAPSASIAVVADGRIAYVKAFGSARIGPPAVPATTSMRYSIGSISKQLTATALLLLAEEGRVSLDDRVVRWFPDLVQARDITLRQLLSMTSGYQDYWPQDYLMPPMRKAVAPAEILDGWAKKPLDFNPGTKWQYSNTNYVIAGLIAEKVGQQPLLELLKSRVFGPLRMTSVVSSDQAPLGAADAGGHVRYALGPFRPAPDAGAGWMFAAGELAMTAEDLARWDVAMIEKAILKPESWAQMQTEVVLANGVGSRYGLGVGLSLVDGRRLVAHGGEVSGFTARNEVYPDDRAAIVVLVNQDATGVSSELARKIREALFESAGDGRAQAVEAARRILEGLQKGQIDRTLFTANANAYFDDQTLRDYASSLRPLGPPKEVTQQSRALRGGMTLRRFKIAFEKRSLGMSTQTMPDGRLEQLIVAPAE